MDTKTTKVEETNVGETNVGATNVGATNVEIPEIKKINTSTVEHDHEVDDAKQKTVGAEPMLLIGTIAILIIYYYMFGSLGNNDSSTSSASPSLLRTIIEYTIWILFIALILINGLLYIFGIDVIKTIKELLGMDKASEEGEAGGEVSTGLGAEATPLGKIVGLKLKMNEEVFHIPGNKYTYDDSKSVCKAYGARLAKYNDVNNAFSKGADWCSYGWSDGQMALFPTQEEKWNKLQQQPGHERDCGRPGINGGYMEDANQKFGINCYGYKPPISATEAKRMRESPTYIKSLKEQRFDSKVEEWRKQLCDIVIAPFNHNNWSAL